MFSNEVVLPTINLWIALKILLAFVYLEVIIELIHTYIYESGDIVRVYVILYLVISLLLVVLWNVVIVLEKLFNKAKIYFL